MIIFIITSRVFIQLRTLTEYSVMLNVITNRLAEIKKAQLLKVYILNPTPCITLNEPVK